MFNEFWTAVLITSGMGFWCIVASFIISFLWTYISYILEEEEFPALHFSVNCMNWLPIAISITALFISVSRCI